MPEHDHRQEPLVRVLHAIIRMAVRVLAILMTLVILMGVVDVFWVLNERLFHTDPIFILDIGDILVTFGAFMAVLIAVEIFVNIVLYLRHDVIHVKLVIATALMAIARKVIILDFAETSAMEALALGVVLVATALAYWIVYRYTPPAEQDEAHHL
jgi:uncharacterized membrane protein (DUF373 family)